jgi:hypothetical protein
MSAADAASIGDVGEAYWKAKLAAVPVGASIEKVEELLGVHGGGGEEGGGGSSVHFALDDFYAVDAHFVKDRKRDVDMFQGFGALVHFARRVDVVVPPDFTGKWKTYFINGVVAGEADCSSGHVTHLATFFDNGQLQSSSDIVYGKPDGASVAFFRDGTKQSEGRYARGERVGPWVEYHRNGKPSLEATYVDGKVEGIELERREDGSLSTRFDYHAGAQTGQAAWDENGKLIYARGTTAPDAGK